MTSVANPATPTSNELLGAPVNREKIENGKNRTGTDVGDFGGRLLLGPEIKQEEPLDIDDTAPADDTKRMPIISLTPTSKLLATPNPTDPKRKFACPYDNCGKSYGKSSHLRSHLTWHTGIKPFVCQEPNCGKGFTRSDELNRHVRTHTGEKPFECVQCTKKFSRSDHLTKHLATHVKQQKTPKRNMNNVVNTNDTTVPRPNGRRNLKRTLAETNNVIGHVMTITPSNGKRQEIDSTETFSAKQLFKINLLGTEMFNKRESDTFTHEPIKIKLERPENSSEYQIVPTSILKNVQSMQSIDESTTEVKSEFIIADDEIMPEANAPPTLPLDVSVKNEPEDLETGRPFHCEHCFRAFRRETDLNRHRHVHSEGHNSQQADVQLPPGVNGSNDKSLLQPQVDFGTGQSYLDSERPFKCKECTKAFRRHDDLYRHMRTHTGEKPFECNECDRRFMRRDHLKKHMQTHIRLR